MFLWSFTFERFAHLINWSYVSQASKQKNKQKNTMLVFDNFFIFSRPSIFYHFNQNSNSEIIVIHCLRLYDHVFMVIYGHDFELIH
jgi:hypothetical protein